jgi:hypothetical protein
MKTLLTIFLLCIMPSFFFNAVSNPKEFICNYTKTPVVIDADLSKWNHASVILLKDTMAKGDNQMKVRSLWDEQNLYLAYEVKDDDLQARQTILDHRELWLDDMIEFLIDPLNEKDSCWDENDLIYHINLLGQKKDDRGSADCRTNPEWNGEAKYAVSLLGTLNDSTDTDNGYIIEISISWAEIGLKPVGGLKLGADFACGDKDGIRNSFFDWVGARPFRSPYAFGDLILRRD